jgi:ankyrin repeat protein
VNDDGHTALARAIEYDHHECAELLFDAGAKIGNVNVPIPDWMNDIVTKRNNLKVAFTVLYGILRRIVVPSAYNPNGDRIPRDMVRVMSYMVLDSRSDPSWSRPAAPFKKLKACKHKCKDKSLCAHSCCKK